MSGDLVDLAKRRPKPDWCTRNNYPADELLECIVDFMRMLPSDEYRKRALALAIQQGPE